METLEFYHDLPPKTCAKCGAILYEQSESYISECEKCLDQD